MGRLAEHGRCTNHPVRDTRSDIDVFCTVRSDSAQPAGKRWRWCFTCVLHVGDGFMAGRTGASACCACKVMMEVLEESEYLLMSLVPLQHWLLHRGRVPGSAVERPRSKSMGPPESAMDHPVPCAQCVGTATLDSVVGHLVSHEMKCTPRWAEQNQCAGGSLPPMATYRFRIEIISARAPTVL